MGDDFTAVERTSIAHACEDYAGNWYGPQANGMTYSISDCGRYTTEAHLGRLHDPYRGGRHTMTAVWAAVREHLDAHPEILAAGRLTDEQRAANQTARDERARELSGKSVEAFYAGRWRDALAFIDRAELESPGLEDYEADRRIVREQAAGLAGNAA